MNNLTTNKYRHSKPGYLQTPVGESPTNCAQSTERKRKSGRKAAFHLVFRGHSVQDLVPKVRRISYISSQYSYQNAEPGYPTTLPGQQITAENLWAIKRMTAIRIT